MNPPADVLRGGGEMGALMRTIDWSATAVGPVERWPQSLKTALSILLETGFPMYIAWGPEFTQFYNDGYRPILGATKHPSAMGASTRDTFREIWHIIGPMFAGVMRGVPTTVVDFLLPLDRYGFAEECYFIFSYSPIRQEDGTVGGVLVTVTETTERVLGERRLKTSQALEARTREARTVDDACRLATVTLVESRADLPFALLYIVDPTAGQLALHDSCTVPDGLAAPAIIPLDDQSADWPMAAVLRSREPRLVELPHPTGGDDGPTRALVLPIVRQGQADPLGVFVAGLSPRLRLDNAYRDFLTMIASQIGTAIVSARALEEAQARADALAEIDRAKTAFFNNVSHEFRTPLTLLLGPTQDALASPDRVLAGGDLETVHRNALRLLKLVNTLLDFSRIEAGRVQAAFEPTDLATLTADLASAFRSATERAGLSLIVDCPPLPEPVYVDREMWEKVVLNLISNAFKFTLEGSIVVALVWRGARVELSVRDTGVGIAAAELPHVFDRFHRVGRAKARTHEGSGIGLALVRELVTMHGGTIDVASTVGEGTTFTVSIPTGMAHLPAERVGAPRAPASTAVGATPYVEEALRWLPTAAAPAASEPEMPTLARVLVADDNADMRDYNVRLIGGRWSVDAVADGAQALAAAVARRPDVIVADVMMPGLDGFELLRALRADERTRSVPVILLSARAGEEARVEGLQAGADDYLVKPFAARELLARVETQIVRAKIRSVEEAHARQLAEIFEHAPVGVAILRGPTHVFEYANPAYLELVAHRPVVGKPVAEALPEVIDQGILALLDGVFATGQPYIGRALRLLLDRGGDQLDETFFDFVYQPLVQGNIVTGIAAVCFEVTELAKARREAEEASRAKDEFLAMLGHELRNPLAPILTALQLMRLRHITGADREREVIERQVRHVIRLVDDLLDVSRIARGKVQLHRHPVALGDILVKAVETTAPAIEERRHSLRLDVPRDLVVDGDAARLTQVFVNLLGNAAKYTDAGGTIEVAARLDDGSVVATVTDTGCGIAPDILPHVFDLFTQERQHVDRSQGGLGLGLAIVRSLVEAHGGSVAVHSAGRGKGSTFEVRLPAAVGEPVPSDVPVGVKTSPDHRRVLVVDDNVDAATMLADSLRAIGHEVRVASDGPDALRLLDAFTPDVVVLDIGLPVMDGFEVAAHIRQQPRFVDLPIVAVTGYGQDADRRRTSAEGFVEHLVKPVDVHTLDRVIRAQRRTTASAS
jgi:signal transduction histidine kinase/DNA-binding response OmpR family regulator